jgi:hypothetical protein
MVATAGMSHNTGDNGMAKAAKAVLATETPMDVQMSQKRGSLNAPMIREIEGSAIEEIYFKSGELDPSHSRVDFERWCHI